jgi:peptide/nickel transport system ATP-binding protein/oligopeptide transport system ATP-binding protein
VGKTYGLRQGVLGAQKTEITALAGVSLDVAPGETLGLVGESGSGKSTLARLMLGLERPDTGDILFEGQSIKNRLPDGFRRRVQMVFQDPYSSLNPRMRVGEIVAEPLRAAGVSRSERGQRVGELLGLTGLRPEDAAKYPHEFSGGQRQRVAIARALAPRPALLVLDEPVSALDVSIQAQILALLGDLQERFSLTYVFISHDLSVVHYVSKRVAVLYLGRLVELAPRDQLYAKPRHPYTQLLLAAVPEPDPTRKRLQITQDRDAVLAAGAAGCPFDARCNQADAGCATVPVLTEVAPDHHVA